MERSMIDYDYSVQDAIHKFDLIGILPHAKPNAIGLWPNEQECLVWASLESDIHADWIEIGSFCGGSTILLGYAKDQAITNSKVIAIDVAFNPMFDLNIRRSGLNNISAIKGDSLVVLPTCNFNNSIGFVFLDGYHSFKNVVSEFELILPHLTDNAIIGFHDCSPNMWANNNQTYIRDRYMFVINNYEFLINNNEQDFYIDEAIAYICMKYDYQIIDIPIRQPLEYFKETGLKKWCRGKTSPHNAFTAIRQRK